MTLRRAFVVARNASGRPTLQHKLIDRRTDLTMCGVDVSAWSRAFMSVEIPQIICNRCKGTNHAELAA